VYDLDFKSTENIYNSIAKEKLKSKRKYLDLNSADEMADDEDECGKNLTNLKEIGS